LEIISDYAHHPTEIKVTLKAIQEKFPNKKIWCIFQPHQYQRTFYLFKDFVKVFREIPIDKLIITDIYDVAGREQGDIKNRINSEKLVKTIDRTWAIYLPKEKIINYLKKSLKGKEVVIIMGAGDIYKITDN
jgi:UDP-N-acetylmuramate--alanine ligase